MILYHGSNVIVQEPQILENGFYKDFGYGFYCTILEKQAKRRKHIVNFMSIHLNEFRKRRSGNWLSLSIRHIRLYSVQRKHYRLSNSKGVIRYDKQIFPGRANNRE